MLYEPVNGLDPDGVRWIRRLTAEHLIVIGRGRLIADVQVDELIAKAVA